MAGMRASEIRELLKVIDAPGVISFAGGIPDPALFPTSAVSEAYDRILAQPDQARSALQYSVSEGDPGLRTWIAQHMSRLGAPCEAQNILITNGSQQALEFLGRALISEGDTALITAPTYLGALQAFAPTQPHYDALHLSDTNQNASSYGAMAARNGGRVALSYVVPDFANPTGHTMPVDQRETLLDLAGELDIPAIEDNPYGALRYEGEPMPPLIARDIARCGTIDASRVIFCGSFSKVFTPGLRVGWVCAARTVITRLTLIKQASDLNSSAINQKVMLHLAETMYDAQVTKLRHHYKPKRDAMLAAMDRHFEGLGEWTRPEGGMFVWVSLNAKIDAARLLEQSVQEASVAFVPGGAFFADDRGTNTLRLNFSLPSIPQIENGIAELAKVIRKAAG
jgi:DNA-binding transcriptional MocR family regulator